MYVIRQILAGIYRMLEDKIDFSITFKCIILIICILRKIILYEIKNSCFDELLKYMD